jgi:hypothetical protein
VELINIRDLEVYVHKKVSISIQDVTGEEELAPFIEKTLQKVEQCPDGTHIRLFFNEREFFAIPRDASVSRSNSEWAAHDFSSKLNYVIRKVNDENE